jgi:hypothetical protein
VAAWEAKVHHDQEVALTTYHHCVMEFVIAHNTPRLTATELADAGVAACESKLSEYGDVLAAGDYEAPAIRRMSAAVREQIRGQALETIARATPAQRP